MNYILFDGPNRNNLLPFTFTRPVADIRIGILTIREKWELMLESSISTITQDFLQGKFPRNESDENIFINSAIVPNSELVDIIINLKLNEIISKEDSVIAYKSKAYKGNKDSSRFKKIEYRDNLIEVRNVWDIFSKNGEALIADYQLLTKNRTSNSISSTNNLIGSDRIFIEDGASLEYVSLNASTGPIYIGKNSEIMEGSVIRGPFSLGEQSTVKMGAKIYGPTTIGPGCKVGGEITNSVFFSNSNKGHEGYLGNSVIGEWCNMGADTNVSNLKNNYAEVRIWNYESERFDNTGLQFCGLMMGDHSKCGINTMFNTGTVVGVNANIFGSGFPRNFIPSFSWGGNSGFTTYNSSKALEVAKIVMSRRNIELTEEDRKILEHVFEETRKYRRD